MSKGKVTLLVVGDSSIYLVIIVIVTVSIVAVNFRVSGGIWIGRIVIFGRLVVLTFIQIGLSLAGRCVS